MIDELKAKVAAATFDLSSMDPAAGGSEWTYANKAQQAYLDANPLPEKPSYPVFGRARVLEGSENGARFWFEVTVGGDYSNNRPWLKVQLCTSQLRDFNTLDKGECDLLAEEVDRVTQARWEFDQYLDRWDSWNATCAQIRKEADVVHALAEKKYQAWDRERRRALKKAKNNTTDTDAEE